MRALRKHTDKQLLNCLRQGDIRAFDELYLRYVPKLMAFARTFFHDKTVAEEATQEIFIRIWEKRRELDDSKSFKAYLFQAVKFYMYNYLRDRKSSCPLEDVPEESFVAESSVQDDLEYEHLEAYAHSVISKLPQVQQEVFRLNKLEGLTALEIADQLNLSKRTIEHHLYLASKTVRSELSAKATISILIFSALLC